MKNSTLITIAIVGVGGLLIYGFMTRQGGITGTVTPTTQDSAKWNFWGSTVGEIGDTTRSLIDKIFGGNDDTEEVGDGTKAGASTGEK